MSENITVGSIRLAHHFKKDTIRVSHIEHPHGRFSSPVVEIDVIINGEKREKLEIPYENLDEVIAALEDAKRLCQSMSHTDVHDELSADVGGGE